MSTQLEKKGKEKLHRHVRTLLANLKKRKKQLETFGIYIYKAMIQIHRIEISSRATDIVNGSYLCVGTILRPIWSMRCIKQEVINNKTQISSTISTNQVNCILSLLEVLKSLVNKNTHITEQPNATTTMADGFKTTISSHYQEPIVNERNSLAALQIFITHACEILEFWKILCEKYLNNIVNCLSKDQINRFSTVTFRELILTAHEIYSSQE